jgi:hypothetical protein
MSDPDENDDEPLLPEIFEGEAFEVDGLLVDFVPTESDDEGNGGQAPAAD